MLLLNQGKMAMVEMFLLSMVSKMGLDKENFCRQLSCLKAAMEQDI